MQTPEAVSGRFRYFRVALLGYGMATMTGNARYGSSRFERFRNLNKVSAVDRLGHADHQPRSLLFRL